MSNLKHQQKAETNKQNKKVDYYLSLMKELLFIPFAAFLVFYFFREAVSAYWGSFAVKPFLAYIKADKHCYTDTVLSFVVILGGFTLVKKLNSNYIYSRYVFQCLIIGSTIYSHYRFFSSDFDFVSFTFAPIFKYADLIYLVTLSGGVIIFRNEYSNRKRTEEAKTKHNPVEILKNGGFAIDKPVSNDLEIEVHDALGFSQYTKNLAERIRLTNPNNSFAIGINAKWGMGKTSFTNILKRNFEQDKKDDTLIEVNFNPWDNNTPNAIIQNFFETFQEAIKPYHSTLPRQLITYSNKLVSLNDDNTTGKYIQVAVSALTGFDSLQSLHKQIDDALKVINRKVVIYIDDLDRLDNVEIIEVLKLIRNTANFHNTIFIVSYDRDYIVNAIGTHNIHRNEFFLEKIFQLEINLPLMDEFVIVDDVWSLLKPYFNNNRFNFVANEILATWLTNMRDVKRLYNSFTLNISELKDKGIDSKDFLLIELLRLKYPNVYAMVSERVNLKKENGFWKIDKNDFEYIKTKNEDRFTAKDNAQIQSLLMELFNENKKNGVSSTSSFHYYFYYNLKKNDIKLSEFQTTLESTVINDIELQIEKWFEDKKVESFEAHLSVALRSIQANRNQLKVLLKMILHFAYLRDGDNNVLNFTRIAQILYDNKLSLNYDDRENIMSHFINPNTKYWHSLADLLLLCFKKTKALGPTDALDKKTELSLIRGWASNLLSNYMKTDSGNINAQTVYTLAVLIKEKDEDSILMTDADFNMLMNNIVKKDPDSFIKWILSKNKVSAINSSSENSLEKDLQIKLSAMSPNPTLYPQSKYLKIWHLYTRNGNTADSLNIDNRNKDSSNEEEEKLAQQLDKEVADLSITNQKRNYSFLG